MTRLISYTSGRPVDDNIIALPLSKSISNRLLLINALGKTATPTGCVADCDDTHVMIQALACEPQGRVDVGAAGTAMRFLTAYYAVTPGSDVIIDGTQRMRERPIGELVDALRQAGADIQYTAREGYPPLHIKGRQLEGGAVEMRADISSQFISAMLMCAPAMTLGLELTLKGDIVSHSYIMMTLNMMASRGIRISISNVATDLQIKVEPGRYRPIDGYDTKVEADWSAASYWYEIVALTGQTIQLSGLSRTSLQGDSNLSYLFEVLGIGEQWDENGLLTLSRPSGPDVEEYEVDMSENPDLAQTIMATCCGLDMPFRLTGLSTLVIKETDRLNAMVTELGKLGFDLTTNGIDEIWWDGTKHTTDKITPVIETYKDHRMAMALAPLAAVAGPMEIVDPEVVTKSYPLFWEQISTAGYHFES